MNTQEHPIMDHETVLISLCDQLKIALDINYMRGTVKVGRKTFKTMSDAVAYAQSKMHTLKNFG
jgi:hypothetical protein